MLYVTKPQREMVREITFDDIFDGPIDMSQFVAKLPSASTVTRTVSNIDSKTLATVNVQAAVFQLKNFCFKFKNINRDNMPSYYHHFSLLKKSGGFRPIDAPNEELMTAQRELKSILENICGALHHTNAYAYVKGRSTVDALKKHQKNDSHWFMKTDFSNFFGSTTPEFLHAQLSIIFPFSEIMKYQDGKEAVEEALSLCFLNGGLPQGTPISPMLTNLMMIPIDHTISQMLRAIPGKKFVYTRYADDILVSRETDFSPNTIRSTILEALAKFNAPYTIKEEKTRYGSRSGRNWNLGLMLNKNNEISLGHQRKKDIKASITNYIVGKKNGVTFDISDIQQLNGLLSYALMVESEYFNYILDSYSTKFNFDVRASIKSDLRGGIDD